MPLPGYVNGSVKNSNGVNIVGASITVNGTKIATTTSQGLYIYVYSAGNFPTTASATGYVTKSSTVTITEGGIATKNFVLTAA